MAGSHTIPTQRRNWLSTKTLLTIRMATRTETELKIGGKPLKVSNLDKVFYPKVGFTKGQVIDYYVRVSKWLLPHLKDRALTLKRYPNGVEGEFFYEKRCPTYRPKWLKTATIWS